MSDEVERTPDELQIHDLRMRIFSAQLIEVPLPEEAFPGLLPASYRAPVPLLIWPPAEEQGTETQGVDLEITPYNIYFGALRARAQTAEPARAAELSSLILHMNKDAARELCELGRGFTSSDLATAIMHYELALELEPELYEACQDAGMCHLMLAELAPHQAEDHLDAAEELILRGLELEPDAALAHWSLARLRWLQGDTEGSRSILESYLQQNPEAAGREMVEEALERGFENYTGLAPEDEEELDFERAQQLTFGGNPAAALDLLRPLAERHTESAEIWFIYGAALRRAGDPEESERCLRRAARLAPAEPFVQWELALTCEALQQYPAAEMALCRALEMDPANAQYLCDLSRIRLALNDAEGAREAALQAYELAPDDTAVQETMAAAGAPRR